MNKLAVFFRTFWKSISSLSYYHDVVKARFGFSFKYFLFFSLLLGTILTIIISLVILPPVSEFLTRFKTRANALYPPDLVITIINGELSTNAAEPFHFPIPFELFTKTPPAISDQKQTYLVTIDTNASVEDYDESQSIVFITKNHLVALDDKGGYRVYPLKDVKDFTLDKKTADQFLSQVIPLLKYVPFLIISLLASVFILILPISRLLSLLFLSLILMIAASLMHLDLTYKKVYQIGLHSLTLPTIIQIVMTMFDLVPPIPFFNSILFLLYTMVILAHLREKPPTSSLSKPISLHQ